MRSIRLMHGRGLVSTVTCGRVRCKLLHLASSDLMIGLLKLIGGLTDYLSYHAASFRFRWLRTIIKITINIIYDFILYFAWDFIINTCRPYFLLSSWHVLGQRKILIPPHSRSHTFTNTLTMCRNAELQRTIYKPRDSSNLSISSTWPYWLSTLPVGLLQV